MMQVTSQLVVTIWNRWCFDNNNHWQRAMFADHGVLCIVEVVMVVVI